VVTTAVKTYQAKPREIARQWSLVDADGKVLGRLAVKVATILMGKHRPTYTPHVDTGDFVIVVNAERIRLTGRKLDQIEYDRFSGYPSGRTTVSLRRMMEMHPERVVELAVRRMLPKTKLGRQMFTKLKVYQGPNHPHQAQQPQPLDLDAMA
jgi:large subunit ribosomal protein L13